jgi:type IV pilus assembly protein PilY1
VVNRFYGIRDEISATSGVTAALGYGVNPPDFYDATGATGIDPLTLASYRGWFINLSTTSPPYEQVVTTPLTIAGVTYFSTYQAMSPGVARSCTNLGTARAYQVDFQTGTGLPGQSVMQPFLSQGIPPSPVGGVVRINGVLTPFLIGGQAPTVLSPTKIVPKVKPNRKPIYRCERVDG